MFFFCDFHFSLSCIGEGNGNTLQCSCLENHSPGGLLSMGSHRVGHDWSDLAAAAAMDVGNLISGSSAFSKLSLNIWKGSTEPMYCWSLAWRILSMTLLAYEMSTTVPWFEHSLALPSFAIGMKTDLFQSCGHCWIFQIYWHTECSTLTASSFRIWNSSAGIPSPSLALFIAMLPKAPLTSHSRNVWL